MTTRLQFTNTKKWNQAWFRKLKPEHKLFWLYVNDMCDHAGFWNVDIELAELCTGLPVDGKEVLEVFKDKLKVLNEDLWWLKEYCIIQSKEFLKRNEKSPPRKSMVDLMIRHDVYNDYITLFYQKYPGEGKAMNSLKDKAKEKEKEKVPEREKDTVQYKEPEKGEYRVEDKPENKQEDIVVEENNSDLEKDSSVENDDSFPF